MFMQNLLKLFQKVQEIGPVTLFFQNLNLGKASTNDKWHLTIPWARSGQYQCVRKKLHHNIPLSSRDGSIFTFSEFGPQHSLDWWQISFCNPMGQILSISTCLQNFNKISQKVQALFRARRFGKKWSGDSRNFNYNPSQRNILEDRKLILPQI